MPADLASTRGGARSTSRTAYLATLALLAFSFMLFQIGILRELRYQLNTLFTLTPFLFSLVVTLIGLGSLVAQRIRDGARVLRVSLLALPLVLLPALALTVVVAQALVDHSGTAFLDLPLVGSGAGHLGSVVRAFLLSAALGYGAVFFFQGIVFALYFRQGRGEGNLSRVYALDLCASGAGAILGGALSFAWTPIDLALLATAGLLAALWVSARFLALGRWTLALASLAALGMIGAEIGSGAIATLESPRWLATRPTHSLWTPYRRIDALETPGTLGVLADGLLFQMYLKGPKPHGWDPRVVTPMVLAPLREQAAELLVIGAGTGTDVRILRDFGFAKLHITAVELDPGFVETARAIPWLWQRYATAEIVVGEGRYFLEKTTRTFDAILYAYVDPQSAISTIGLPDANYLYTDAGLRAAFSRLRPGGTLIITRVFFLDQLKQTMRRLCATLSSAGIPGEHVQVHAAPGGTQWGYYGKLSTLHVIAGKGHSPSPVLPALTRFPCEPGGRPTTDLYPLSIETGVWFDRLGDYLAGSTVAVTMLGLLLLGLLARLTTSLTHASFFVLGLGSFLVEAMVLFSSFLLIGNPSLSAALAVGVLLLWNALGSACSGLLERRRWLLWAVPLAVAFYCFTAPWLSAWTISSSVGVRILCFSLHLGPVGVAVGAMFPFGLRRFPERQVPALFFIDLVGCALAPVVFWLLLSATGYASVAALAVGCYAAVTARFAFLRRPA